MMDYGTVSNVTYVLLCLGAAIFLFTPIIFALIWKQKKNEPFTTVLIGAATFLVFVIVEKFIQSIFIMQTSPLGAYINARPVLWAFTVGFLPGIFEETGRLVAFKTLLRKRTQRETPISYGIGHGGIAEVSVLMTYTCISNISVAIMINSGQIGTLIDQYRQFYPNMLPQVEESIRQITSFTFLSLLLMIVERVFAVMYHIGASILVFYACKDKKKFWLYPLAVVIHGLIDMSAGLAMVKVIDLPGPVTELPILAGGLLVFFLAYFLLYRKDKTGVLPETEAT